MERLRIALTERRLYDALNWNCETFAKLLIREKPESKQATGWVTWLSAVRPVRRRSRRASRLNRALALMK